MRAFEEKQKKEWEKVLPYYPTPTTSDRRDPKQKIFGGHNTVC